MERKRLIRISKNRIFLTPELSLSLSQTSLVGKNLSFRTHEDIYFQIEVLAHDKELHKIRVEIIDYQPANIDSFKDQTAKGKVLFIQFIPLKWEFIEKYLSSYTKNALIREKIVIEDISEINIYKGENQHLLLPEINKNYAKQQFKEPFIERITEEAKIYFKEAIFNLGFVAFSYKSKINEETYNLKIENHYLLPEFNAIKSYFPKAFGGKKQFSINIIFTLIDKIVTDIVTTSPEIERINENILDCVKRERVAKLISTPLHISINKSLFTAEDIFDSFEDNLKDGNIFNQSEEDILNFLLETKVVRNAKHLQFLSGSKHSIKQKLLFTLKPLFGFVFFTTINLNYSYI